MDRIKILIVEDERIVAMELHERLIKNGFFVIGMLKSGEEAVQSFQELKPDLIMMDIMLAGNLDGIETAKKIKTISEVPFIFLTAFTDKDTIDRAMEVGPYAYLRKPYEEHELLSSIQIALSKNKLEKKLREREELLATTLSNASDSVITVNTSLVVSYLNKNAEELFNLEDGEFIGKPLHEILLLEKVLDVEDEITRLSDIAEFKRYKLLRKNGGPRWIDIKNNSIINSESDRVAFVITIRDVTDFLKTQEIIEQTESKIKAITDAAEIAIYNFSLESRTYKYMSDIIEKIVEYSAEEFSYEKFLSVIIKAEIIKPEYVSDHQSMMDIWYKGELDEYQADLLIKCKSGKNKWISDKAKPWRDMNGKVIGSLGILQDITERKLSETVKSSLYLISEAANQSDDLNVLFSKIHEIVADIIKAENFFIALYDRRTNDLTFPYYKNEFTFAPHKKKLGLGSTDYIIRTGKTLLAQYDDFENLQKEGKAKSWGPVSQSWLGVPLRGVDAIIGAMVVQSYDEKILFDEIDKRLMEEIANQVAITIERKITYDALIESEVRYRDIFNYAPVGIYQSTMSGKILSANKAFLDIVGFSSFEEISSYNMRDLYYDSYEREELIRRYLSVGKVADLEVRWRNKSNQEIFIQLSTHAIKNDNDEVIYFEGFVRDISSYKSAQKSIKITEQKFKELFNNASDAIFILSMDGEILEINEPACQRYEYTREDMIGKTTGFLQYGLSIEAHTKIIKSIIKKGKGLYELEHITKLGKIIPTEISSKVIEFQDSKAILNIARDITERKIAEQKILQSEKEYRGLFENAHDAIMIFEPENEIILEANKRALELYEFSRDEFIGLSLITLSQNPEFGRNKVNETLQNKATTVFETYQQTRSGREIILEVNASIVTYRGKDAILSINHDITARKIAEDELKNYQLKLEHIIDERTRAYKESEEKFKTLAENTDDLIIRFDRELRHVYVNSAVEKIFKISADEIINKTYAQLGYPETLVQITESAIKNVFEKKEKVTIEYQLPGGEWLEWMLLPEFDDNNEVNTVLTSARDVTERKINEEKIIRRDKILQAVANSSVMLFSSSNYENVMEVLLNEVGTAASVDRAYLVENSITNDNTKAMQLNYSWISEEEGKVSGNFMYNKATYKSLGIERWLKIMTQGKSISGLQEDFPENEKELLKSQRITSIALVPIIIDNFFWGFIGFEDCRNQKNWNEAELAVLFTLSNSIGGAIKRATIESNLRHSETMWRQLFQFSPEPFYLFDYHGNIIDCNNESTNLIGYTKEELLGHNLNSLNLVPPEYENITNIVGDKSMKGEASGPFEFEIITKQNKRITIEFKTYPVSIGGKELILGAAHNIDIRKKAELEIKRALDKANELNELKSRFVSMVSHEFRTPLSAMLSSAEIMELLGENISSHERNEYLKKIVKSIDYMTELLNDVLTINKADAGKLYVKYENLDIVELTENILNDILLTNDDVEISFLHPEKEMMLETDKKLYRQIVTNLVSNAIKYSPEDAPVICRIAKRNNSFILEVEDEGIGIPDKDLEDIFSPFQRASNIGNRPGTGLGLAITKRSVESLKGSIKVDSEMRRGTKFTVMLPITTNGR
ncbi:MAG: PAS domain S-box protein [Melioribacteraceae bacterium]|nr:PAS domain S-box protein [Melioribacteraceae bacterium]